MKSLLTALLINVALTAVDATAQQDAAAAQQIRAPLNSYQILVARTNAVILTEKHLVNKPTRTTPEVSIVSARTQDGSSKFHAANFGEVQVDLNQLAAMQKDTESLIEAVTLFLANDELAGVRYNSSEGLHVSCYRYNDNDGKARRNVLVQFGSSGGTIFQSDTAQPLTDLRPLIAQAREKLIALGAR